MRMVFGLVSLLVVIGIIMLVFRFIEVPQIEQGQKAQQAAQQLSGHDTDGTPAYKTYVGEEYDVGSNFKGIKVTSLTPGGAMESAYGLKVGDIVLQVGDLDVTTLGDYGAAKGQLDQAYQEARALTVLRDGNKMTLTCKSALNSLMPSN